MSEFTGEVHPVADLFPMLPDDELDDLAADIAERGLLQPIVLDTEGRVLDGRNRLAACKRAELEPEFETYDGDDPAGYALAVNISRRHLSKGQQAMVWAQSGVEYRNDTQAVVSKQRVSHARTVLNHAPDLADAVVAGATPLDSAYKVARERKQEAESTEAQLDRLRAEAPDLADLVTEERISLSEAIATLKQREADRQAAIGRVQSGLRELVNGWIRLVSLPEHEWRDEIIKGLSAQDRDKVLEIESIYLRGNGK